MSQVPCTLQSVKIEPSNITPKLHYLLTVSLGEMTPGVDVAVLSDFETAVAPFLPAGESHAVDTILAGMNFAATERGVFGNEVTVEDGALHFTVDCDCEPKKAPIEAGALLTLICIGQRIPLVA